MGKRGEKKAAVSTNNLKKSATQSFQPNSEHLLFIVHASWVGFPFPADAKPSGFFQRRYKQFTSVLLCTDLSRACMQTFKAARSYLNISTGAPSASPRPKTRARPPRQAREWPSQPPRRSCDLKYKESCTLHSVRSLDSYKEGLIKRISKGSMSPFISKHMCCLAYWKESQAGYPEKLPWPVTDG